LHLNFDELFSEFHRCVRKCKNSLRIAEKLQTKSENSKFRENSESGDNIFFVPNEKFNPVRSSCSARAARGRSAGPPVLRRKNRPAKTTPWSSEVRAVAAPGAGGLAGALEPGVAKLRRGFVWR